MYRHDCFALHDNVFTKIAYFIDRGSILSYHKQYLTHLNEVTDLYVTLSLKSRRNEMIQVLK